jgi:hypothetical protein
MANMTGMAALAELRKEFTVRGWHRKATTRVVSGLLLNFAIALAGIYIFVLYDDLLVRVCAMILSTAGSMGVATNTHTSSHYATSEKRWVNEFLTFFGYPVFLGLSACYWWHQHVVIHHPAPNVVGVDDDADLAPWFARTKEEVQRSTGLRRFYYEKLQFFVFPLALGFNGFNMQKSGWTRLIGTLCRQGRMVNKRHWIDLAAMILHYPRVDGDSDDILRARRRSWLLRASDLPDGVRDVHGSGTRSFSSGSRLLLEGPEGLRLLTCSDRRHRQFPYGCHRQAHLLWARVSNRTPPVSEYQPRLLSENGRSRKGVLHRERSSLPMLRVGCRHLEMPAHAPVAIAGTGESRRGSRESAARPPPSGGD